MTTTIRVRKNRKSSPRRTQEEILVDKSEAFRKKTEFAPPEGECHPSCLAIYCRGFKEGGGHGPVSKIPLSEREFAQLFEIKYDARLEGQTLEGFIAGAVRSELVAVLTDKHQRIADALSELEIATSQSLAMMELMLNDETHRMMEGDLEHQDRNSVNAGVNELVKYTKKRLQGAYASAFSAVTNKPEVAS